MLALYEIDIDSSNGWGLMGLLYALPFSIVALVKTMGSGTNIHDRLLKLNELKEKNIITESEFDKKKEFLLSKYH